MDIFLLLALLVFAVVITSKISNIQEVLNELVRRGLSPLRETKQVHERAQTESEIKDEQKELPAQEDKYTDVVGYIQKKISSGISISEITGMLERSGWGKEDIDVAFSRADITVAEDDNTSVSIPQQREEAVTMEKHEEDPFTVFFKWLANDWLMKVGAFLIILAFGWFVSYSFMEGWIGPGGRITIGIIIGLAILLLGEWRIKEYKNQGAVLLALGSAGILITIFSARAFYPYMFSSTAALVFMFVVVAYLGFSSVRHKSKALAVLALVLGFLVPLLTHSPQPDFVGLFSYLLVVSAGVLWVAGVTGWRPLVPSSLLGMFAYSFMVFGMNMREPLNTDLLFVIALIFAGMYFVVGMAAMVSSRKAYISDLFTAAGVGMFTLMWILVHLDETLWSLATVMLALVFSVGAFSVYRITSMKEPFYVYGSIALVFVGIATALELDGPALTLVAIFEVATVVALIKGVLKDTRLAQYTSLLMIIPGLLSLTSLTSSAWRDGIMHGDFVVVLSMAVALSALGVYFGAMREEGERVSESGIMTFFVFSGLYTLALIWLVPYALFSNDTAIMVVLTIHTVIGLYFYLTGISKGKSAFKIIGVVFLGFVILRLMPLAWELPPVGRVIIFTLIGVLLMSTAFIGRSKKITHDGKTEEGSE